MADILPSFPDFREIHFEDKQVIEEAFKINEPIISEYTFTNLFVWRETSKVLISQIGKTILIKRWNSEINQYFIFPPIGEKGVVDAVNDMLSIIDRRNLPPLYGINRMEAESLKNENFTIKEMRDSWDYVYLVRNLADLPGEKYYVKRKNIEKCLEDYQPKYETITKEIVDQCVQLQTSWCNLRNCNANPGLEAEQRAIKEAFFHFNNLNIFGGAIIINNKVEAFTIGERLNKDTSVIHFEKANPNITGLYQVINQCFCINALQGFMYVNREQDLGIPGLRQAKMSYHPSFFIEKYLATS